ncbi:MAG TPA: serine hydrolase domain-containing protein, partial [Cyclobacteriaceae bacterium]|nr:serine hydrolase domain-containing protein [Cyclobacteriaceae bacterium]
LSTALLLICLGCQQTVTNRGTLTTAQPEQAGFSSERLARIDTTLNRWVTDGWMNGAVAFIAHDGKIVYHKAFGYNNPATNEKLQTDHLFRIASQTKAITSVAVMMLYEEGKFLLDDPLAKYIPAFGNATVLNTFNATDTSYTTVPAKRAVTVRDLLTHTSGIGYAQIGSAEANALYAKANITAGIYDTRNTLADAIDRLGKLPLMHQPGERWTYGLNTDVLGRLVEVLSGQTLETFFTERIFKPLGMNDTYFNVPEEKASRLVNFFTEDSAGLHITPNVWNTDMDYPLHKKSYFSGGAGLTSTVYDYAIFLQMLLNNGTYNGVRILSRNTVRLMTMNQIGDLALGDDKFGLGFLVVSEKGSAQFPHRQGTYSWGGAFSTSYWVDPEEKLVVLLYRQMWGSHGELGNLYKVLVYQALNE